MKSLAVVLAFAVALVGGLLSEAQAGGAPRHYLFGVFTLNAGEAADLTEEHIPLEFVRVWPHPFGNRAIYISLDGKAYSVGVGTRIDLKSSFLRAKAGKAESALDEKNHCDLEIADFENQAEGVAKVLFALDCM